MYNNLVFEGPYSNKDFFNFIQTSQEPRHRWYYFKEGFSTNVVKEAISAKSSKNKLLKVLDPFNGCGTTALTSSLLRHNSVGVEVNPFLEFTTKVKTNSYPIKEAYFKSYLEQIITESKLGSFSALELYSTFTPKSGNEKWLFNTSVIRRYTAMMEVISELPYTYRNALKFLTLSAMMDCCNARKDGKGLRYKKDWKIKKYSSRDLESCFRRKAGMFLDDIVQAPIKSEFKPRIHLGDSREVLGKSNLFDDKFDLIVTSPPYLNSFDYSDIYRAELFLGGFVTSNDELRKIRLKTLRSHVQVSWEKTLNFESRMLKPYLDAVVNSGSFWNPRIPLMIKAYFDDMFTVLTSAKKLLKKGGEVWLVVSTSAYAGVHIPVDLLIADLACQGGFTLKGIHCLRYLRTSSQQYKELNVDKSPLRESLIILKK